MVLISLIKLKLYLLRVALPYGTVRLRLVRLRLVQLRLVQLRFASFSTLTILNTFDLIIHYSTCQTMSDNHHIIYTTQYFTHNEKNKQMTSTFS